MDETTARRFWSKVELAGPSDCWLWSAGCFSSGYGSFWDGRAHYAHRVAYELAIGPIPDGLELDHVRSRGCTSRRCCNPSHLEPVSGMENIRRGRAGRPQASRTHCPQGHPYDEANTYIRPDRPGHRECRTCRNEAANRHKERLRGLGTS